MDSSDGVFIGILLAFIFWIFGPTTREVNADRWQKATELCQVNDGVRAVEITSFYGMYEVYCNNGASFNVHAYRD